MKRLAVIFAFSAAGLFGGSLATISHFDLKQYEDELRAEGSELEGYAFIQEAVNRRTEDNVNDVRTGFGAGLAGGLLVAGGMTLFRRKP